MYSRKRSRHEAHSYARRRPGQTKRKTTHGAGHGGVGSGGRMLPKLRAPPISKLERQLDYIGVPVQRFRQFRSEERVNVNPDSGHCAWYCVPVVMEIGNPMVVFDYNTLPEPNKSEKYVVKQTPNTCDLYDVYRNLTAGVGPGSAYGVDPRAGMGIQGASVTGSLGDFYLGGPFGTQDTTTVGLASQIPPSLRISKPGMDYQIRSHITYDNVSSLDAFVEVYKLVYKPRAFAHSTTNHYELGANFALEQILWRNAFNSTDFVWKHATAVNPGTQFCPVTDVQKYQSANYGGSLLKAYADAVRYARYGSYASGTSLASISMVSGTEQGFGNVIDLQPAKEGGTANAAGAGGFADADTYDQILCHPKVDPLKCCPPRRNTSSQGFTMERVRSVQRIKPGHSARFNIPNVGVRHWSYQDSPQGRKNQETAPFTQTAAGYTTVYCFRVWGDMIHSTSHVAGAGETDFQTGSCAVTFDVQKVMWARVRARHFTVTNPTLLPFDAAVDRTVQEQLNDESDTAMIVDRVGRVA